MFCFSLLLSSAFLFGQALAGVVDFAEESSAGSAYSESVCQPPAAGFVYSFGITDDFSLPSDDELSAALEDAASLPIPNGPQLQIGVTGGTVLDADYQSGQKRVEMGAVTLGDLPGNRTFTLTNIGDEPLRFPDIPSIWLSGPNAAEFSIFVEEIPKSLAPGAKFSFDLRFSPRESGEREATVHISSSDPNRALLSFEVAGMGNQIPHAEAGDAILARKLDTVALSALGSHDPDGDSVSLTYRWFYLSGPVKDAPTLSPDASSETVTFVPTEVGTYTFEVVVSDGMSSATDQITITVTSRTRLVTGNTVASSGEWAKVKLPYAYESMVVVCTLQYDYDPNRPPIAARVTDAIGDSFKVRLYSADSKPATIQDVLVHYVVVEEGAYTSKDDGINMEAYTYISSDVSAKGARRSGNSHSYTGDYADPVVVGQIMSTNDPNYQVFWAHGATPLTPPDKSALNTGRHIGEDPNSVRLAETVGYIVLESGLNSCDGTRFVAGRTARAVKGVAGGTHNEDITSIIPASAVLSNAGLGQEDGGYPVLSGTNALGEHHISVAIEEDTLLDLDRMHPPEEVAFIAFDTTKSALPIALDISVDTPADTDVHVSLTGKNLSGNETWSIVNQPEHGTLSGTLPNLTYTPEIGYEGEDSFTYSVSDGGVSSETAEVDVTVKPVNPFLFTGVVSVGTDTWTNVALPRSFVSMVAVCTPAYNPAERPPMAVRVQNAYGNSFQVRLYRADNQAEPVTNVPVHYIVIEEGRYTAEKHGATVEARRYICSPQDDQTAWTLASQPYKNTYFQPIVIGQVLSANCPDFQVFWATDKTYKRSPDRESLFTGRHVGEDPNMSRSPEDVGYIVFEAGNGTLAGLGFEAGLTPRTVTHNPSRHCTSIVKPEVTLLSTSGIRGSNGCFPVLVDPVPTAGGFRVALAEDFLHDSERSHAAEHVAFIAIHSSESTQPYAVDQYFELERTASDSAVHLPVTLKALSVDAKDEWLVTKAPANGSLEGTAPRLKYVPNPGFEGTDEFSYRLQSASGDSNTAKVRIRVGSQPSNSPPVMESIWAGPDPDNLSSPAILEVTAWDPDGDQLTHSWECIEGPGNVTFEDFRGTVDPLAQTPVSASPHTQASFSESGAYTLKVTTSDANSKPATSLLSVRVKAPTTATVVVPRIASESQPVSLERFYLLFLLAGPSLAIAFFWLKRSLSRT